MVRMRFYRFQVQYANGDVVFKDIRASDSDNAMAQYLKWARGQPPIQQYSYEPL